MRLTCYKSCVLFLRTLDILVLQLPWKDNIVLNQETFVFLYTPGLCRPTNTGCIQVSQSLFLSSTLLCLSLSLHAKVQRGGFCERETWPQARPFRQSPSASLSRNSTHLLSISRVVVREVEGEDPASCSLASVHEFLPLQGQLSLLSLRRSSSLFSISRNFWGKVPLAPLLPDKLSLRRAWGLSYHGWPLW